MPSGALSFTFWRDVVFSLHVLYKMKITLIINKYINICNKHVCGN